MRDVVALLAVGFETPLALYRMREYQARCGGRRVARDQAGRPPRQQDRRATHVRADRARARARCSPLFQTCVSSPSSSCIFRTNQSGIAVEAVGLDDAARPLRTDRQAAGALYAPLLFYRTFSATAELRQGPLGVALCWEVDFGKAAALHGGFHRLLLCPLPARNRPFDGQVRSGLNGRRIRSGGW